MNLLTQVGSNTGFVAALFMETSLIILGVMETFLAFGKTPTNMVRSRKRLIPVTARITLQKPEQIVSSAVSQTITALII